VKQNSDILIFLGHSVLAVSDSITKVVQFLTYMNEFSLMAATNQ